MFPWYPTMLLIYSPYIVEYKFPLYPHQNHIKTHQNTSKPWYCFTTSRWICHARSTIFRSIFPHPAVSTTQKASIFPAFCPFCFTEKSPKIPPRHVPPGRRPHSPARDSHPRCTSERRPRPCLWPRFPRWAPWIGWKRSPPEFSADFWRGFLGQMSWDDMMTIGKYHGFYIMGMSWDDHGMTITNDW